VRGLFPEPPQPPTAPEQVEVRPVEEATTAASQNADAYWKTVGSLFCFANLAACAVVGLVKSPPGIVQTMQQVEQVTAEAMDQLKQTTEKVKRDVHSVRAKMQRHMDEAKRASQRE
jgi:hypothetical protein